MAGGASASSTIAQPAASTGRATVLTRASLATTELFFTEASLKDPGALYRVLHSLWSQLSRALRDMSSNPVLASNMLTGLVFTAGQTQYVAHGLGRPYRGYYAVRSQGAPAVFVEATLPAGASSAKLLPLTSSNAGTYSLVVF